MDEWGDGTGHEPGRGCVMAMLVSCCIWMLIVMGILWAGG